MIATAAPASEPCDAPRPSWTVCAAGHEVLPRDGAAFLAFARQAWR